MLTGTEKIFRYLTPVLSTLPAHLSDTEILSSRSFHLLADPNELIEQIQQLLILRKVALIYDRPLIVWEPMPSSCIPANLNAFFKAVREVDVFSPNHVELGGIFGQPLQSQFDASQVERLALPFMTSGIGASRQGSVVVRAGEHGSFIASAMQPSTWLPAYYTQVDSGNEANGPSLKVIDPTGAGNAFLGAFAIGLLNTSSVFEAACYGTIGSSFALEQVGLPEISVSGDEELWNGESAMSRLNQYKQRLQNSAKRSLP